ncbi:hypothetical protein M3Y95_00541200 [Aphelenchoides besseyi]|nr:hypothetical protein M3Y95_00541200 [Aphelenchoides besseyi]
MTSAAILKEIEGLDFYKQFFDEEIYEDGRGLDEDRAYVIKTGLDSEAVGSAYVQYQGSTVSCKVIAKAGYTNKSQCLKFKLERSNCVPKREFDFVRGVLQELTDQNAFVEPLSMVFDVEYQVQLKITLTINTCDGFLLGAVLMAANSALLNTRLVELTSSVEETDDPVTRIRFIRRKNPFRANFDKMNSLNIETLLFYTGILVIDSDEGEEPLLLCDPPEDLVKRVRKRVDLILDSDGTIRFWQNSGFDGIDAQFRRKVYELAKNRQETATEMLNKVRVDGHADSEL